MHIDRILGNAALRKELEARLASEEASRGLHPEPFDHEILKSTVEELAGGLETTAPAAPEYEAIVRQFGRPVLFVRDDVIDDPESELWRERLAAARPVLEAVLPAVGRIDLRQHPNLPYAGTGWLVAPDVAVTNRHVANVFARRSGGRFVFRHNPRGRPISAQIDFRHEHRVRGNERFRVREVLHIEPDEDGAPDIAFLRVARTGRRGRELATPVRLAAADPEPNAVIGVVGYAASDGRRNDPQIMRRIFGNVYNVKRLHPGEVMALHEHHLTHDCSTLGGNSGSPIFDFATGEAVGLHFAGSFKVQNYAVKASTVRRRMEELGIGRP